MRWKTSSKSRNYTDMMLLACWVTWHSMWRTFTRLCITKINFSRRRLPKELWKCSLRRLNEDNPLGSVLFYKSKFLVSFTRMCQDPVGHTSNSTVTTADGTTEHTEDEWLGAGKHLLQQCVSQTGNNDGKSWSFPSYLYRMKISNQTWG